MAAPKASVLGAAGSDAVALDDSIFAAEVKPHLVHEAVRAELNARRAGTRAAKSRGLVSGGRSKPWRQKGTGRARAGTTRAPQWTGGGVVFPPSPRNFEVKVNRKAAKAALRSALSSHAQGDTLAFVDPATLEAPSTRKAAELLGAHARPAVVVVLETEASVAKSFRNLDRVEVVTPSELEVAAVVWARTLVLTEGALEVVQRRAS